MPVTISCRNQSLLDQSPAYDTWNGHVLGDHMTDKLDQTNKEELKKKPFKNFAAQTLAVVSP